MGKTGSSGLGQLALGALAVYLAFWSYRNVGWVVAVAVVLVAVVIYAGWRMHVKRREQATFNKLIQYLLVKRLPEDQEKRLDSAMARKRPARAALIGRTRELRAAMETALTSKQRDTAEAGMRAVRDLHAQIKEEHDTLISAELMAEINAVISKHEKSFNTRFYTNVAQGLLEQADSEQDSQAKAGYATRALQMTREGLDNPQSDPQTLQELHERVEQFMQRIEAEERTIQLQSG